MRHHTATHLLNSSLRKILPVTGQQGSTVSKDGLYFQFHVFGDTLSPSHIKSMEKLINDTIDADVAVKTRTVDALGLTMEEDITLVPGGVYPDKEIRIVEIVGPDLKST